MKEVINAYRTQKINVDYFLKTFINSLPKNYIDNPLEIVKKNRFIQLMYGVDSNFKQATPIFSKKDSDSSQIGNDKSHYFMKLQLDDDSIYISNPYIHHKTGKASLSIVQLIGSDYYVFDINLIHLLEDLKLIQYNSIHDKVKRTVYFFGSTMLAIVAIALIAYGGYIFFALLFSLSTSDFLHDIFTSIISMTLGLAIYDLAKQIFEHEVMYQSFHQTEDKQYKVLGKFLISIIIALSIETLMVVFKIALDDTSQMLNAFYLLIGTTIMLIGLGYFYKTIQESTPKDDC
ncbi:hypothetical protein SMGD1_0448 [Sulfurimonas gotlandica GD1]|jgi:hypothetical protein|uniref:General glycosylation pathway protein n=1 Tax=Sulfurimonas gotlandica (strain DSM 19862 / JCM 16533 / GD1) TaxID=929558 RepID=B6BKC0_SULGG|nr:hypothetical protein [Sulfurimonas gotlandica]EDZ62410.1 conserved hypothetical protein [Sulfurimonas gotlandica GD1]EHP28975.1 hypothetical protein SMGD1_0448 [Sulfurimonas gotlandica GD1]